jgi:nucleoside-diphosphate-sugar epimerase
LRSMEDQLRTARDTRQMETVALRIGFLYGPEAPATRMLIQQARAGWLFAPRGLTGLSPFVHIDDTISAIIAAIEKPSPSVSYNVVDDEPVKLESFLDLLVQAAGARRVKRAPGWLVRLTAPLLVDLLSARLLLSNAAAKQELGWRLRYPTIREGLQTLRGAIQEAA